MKQEGFAPFRKVAGIILSEKSSHYETKGLRSTGESDRIFQTNIELQRALKGTFVRILSKK